MSLLESESTCGDDDNGGGWRFFWYPTFGGKSTEAILSVILYYVSTNYLCIQYICIYLSQVYAADSCRDFMQLFHAAVSCRCFMLWLR